VGRGTRTSSQAARARLRARGDGEAGQGGKTAGTDRALLHAALRRAGLDAYEVGGCVRDRLLGVPAKDIDIAVCKTTYEQLASRLAAEEGVTVSPLEFDNGHSKQIIGVRLRAPYTDKEGVEIALGRSERSTGAGHHGFEVTTDPAISIEDDLARRDFTINAMAIEVATGKLIDPYGGAADLAAGRLRAVSERSFEEDPLRLLRGITAISRFDVRPDEQTFAQMRRCAGLLSRTLPADGGRLPDERIRMELEKTLGGRPGDAPRPAVADALRIARDTGILTHALPELAPTLAFDQDNPYHDLTLDEHIFTAIERASQANASDAVRWALLFHDAGKPQVAWRNPKTGRLSFYANPDCTETVPADALHPEDEVVAEHADGTVTVRRPRRGHAEVGAEIAVSAMRRLRCPAEQIKRVELLVREHMFSDDDGFDDLPEHKQRVRARRFIHRVARDYARREPGRVREIVEDLLLLRRCDRAAKRTITPQDWLTRPSRFEQIVGEELNSPVFTWQINIDGRELVKLVGNGPQVGSLLEQLRDELVNQPHPADCNTPEWLLARARRIAGRHPSR